MPDLTVQQELFCQKYIECKGNASEAYRQSYNCAESGDNTIWVEASRLMQNPMVSLRIRSLQEEAAERNRVTVDSITNELEEIRRKAISAGEFSPAVSSVMGKAKLHGLITDKSRTEIVNPAGQKFKVSLTVEDANKQYTDLLDNINTNATT